MRAAIEVAASTNQAGGEAGVALTAEPARSIRAARPGRILAAGVVVNSLGNGLYFPLALVLLDHLTDLGLRTVGAMLTVAACVGLATMPLTGMVIDRFGPRSVQIWALIAQAVGFIAYTVAEGPILFAVAAVAVALGNQTVKTTQPVLISALAHGTGRARLLALTRSLSNAALGLGALTLALVPAGAGYGWYLAIAIGNAASFVVAAGLVGLLPRPTKAPRAGVRIAYVRVVRDRLFMRFTAANALSSLNYAALSNLVPLVTVVAMGLSPRIAGILYTINTVVTAVAGVPIITWLQRHGLGNRPTAIGGLTAMAAGMAGLGLAALCPSHTTMIVIMVTSMIVYSFGETAHSPSSTALALDAAPDGQRGQYQSAYQMSWAAGTAAAPALFTALIAVGAVGAVAVPATASILAAALLVGRARTADAGGLAPASR